MEEVRIELEAKDGAHKVKINKAQYPVVRDLVLEGASGAEISRTLRHMKLGDITSRQGRRVKKLMQQHLPSVIDNYEAPEDPYADLEAVEPTSMGAVIFDLECLSPSFYNIMPGSHTLLCGSFLPSEGLSWGSPYTIEITYDEMRDVNEQRVLKAILEELKKYRFIIGHNVKGYDINLLYTKAMYYRIPMGTTRLFYYDTFSALKRNPIKSRKGLGNMLEFLRIPVDVADKPNITALEWDSIRTGDEDSFDGAMEMVVDRCESDVGANLQLFSLLMDNDLRYDRKPSFKLWPN